MLRLRPPCLQALQELDAEKATSAALRRELEQALKLSSGKGELEGTMQALSMKVAELEKELTSVGTVQHHTLMHAPADACARLQISSERMKRLGEARKHASRCEQEAKDATSQVAHAEAAAAAAWEKVAAAQQVMAICRSHTAHPQLTQCSHTAHTVLQEGETNKNEMWAQRKRAQDLAAECEQMKKDAADLKSAELTNLSHINLLEQQLIRLNTQIDQLKVLRAAVHSPQHCCFLSGRHAARRVGGRFGSPTTE